MRIIISPAKKMNIDLDTFPIENLPRFLTEANELMIQLKKLDYSSLKKLWGCNDSIARLNFKRLQSMDLYHNLTPAILSYDGILYRYMAPGFFEDIQYKYMKKHLRILSGFYGLLRPFDGVTPYRLEMQAKLSVGSSKNLYAFWGDRLAKELASETDFLLNLASKEYSKVVTAYLPSHVRVLTCKFGELKENKVIEKGTFCKMARGEMVRYLIENAVAEPKDIQKFDHLGYCYSPEQSAPDCYVFLKQKSDGTSGGW